MTMFGWMGTILRVDLTAGRVTKEPLLPEVAQKYLGGSGLGSRILWDEVGPDVSPYDPDNRLILSVGPLIATLSPASGRLNITCKSPLTGGYGDSNIGGSWGPEFKFAGYDALIVQGKAASPVYLWIEDDRVEIRDASHLWGETTWRTEDILTEELMVPGVRIMSIGPAGENLVRCAAAIANRSRAAAWSGVGAVMGSKNLKAIAVRGTEGVKIARPQEFVGRCIEAVAEIKQSATIEEFSRKGMPYLTFYNQGPDVGGMPTGSNCCLNWTEPRIPADRFEQCTADYLIDTQVVKSKACFGCMVHCSHWLRVEGGKYHGTQGEGFEWNAHGEAFKVGIFNQDWITANNNLCNQLGLDIDGPGCVIAWAMECYAKGLLTKEDTGGIDLTWGNEDSVFELTRKIAYKEGFGALLAEGSYEASKRLGRGSERYALYGKGGCEARWDHRWAYGWLLGQAVSTRGPDHLKGCTAVEYANSEEYMAELGLPAKASDCLTPEGKPELCVFAERMHALCDSVTMCKFPTVTNHTTLREGTLAKLITAATGWEVTGKELKVCADRINALQKAFNTRSGIGTRDNDFLPRRVHEDPIDTALPIVSREVLEEMKDGYYALRGWDVETGLQTRASLRALGLDDVADGLEQQGLLPR
jgi:aldehyde:ferredoxin oxidoreductase